MPTKKNIIIVSNESWGDLWFSKHHYADELSKSHSVIFINPTQRWQLGNLFDFTIQEKKINSNLTVISYRNFLPHYFLNFNNRIVSKRISNYFGKIKFVPDILWTFDPSRLYDGKLLRAKKTIFHIVDKYIFHFKSERILCNNVNGFVVVAEELASQYKEFQKPILHVPHGVPSIKSPDINIHIPFKDYLFYMGTMDARLDYKLIVQMVKRFPNEKFLFLGNCKNVINSDYDQLFIQKVFPNFIHLPAVHPHNLGPYIANAKCCLAPMWNGFDGNMISHHKILQYLDFGKAVFSPVFSAYLVFSDLLYMENNQEVLLNKLNKFLEEGESTHLAEKRINLAKKNKYENHASKILNFIEKEL